MKRFVTTLGLIILIVGSLFLLHSLLRREILRRLEKSFHAEVTSRSLFINPLKGIDAIDLRVGNFLRADSLEVRFTLLKILKGNIQSLKAWGATVYIDSIHSSQKGRGKRKGKFSPPPPPRLEIGNVVLYGVSVKIGTNIFKTDTLFGEFHGKEAHPRYRFRLRKALLAGLEFDYINLKLLYDKNWKIESLSFKGTDKNLDVGVAELTYPKFDLTLYGFSWGKQLKVKEGELSYDLRRRDFTLKSSELSIGGREIDTLLMNGNISLTRKNGALRLDNYQIVAPEGKISGWGDITGFLKGLKNTIFNVDFVTDSLSLEDEPIKGLSFKGKGNISGTLQTLSLRGDFSEVSFLGYRIPHLSGKVSYTRDHLYFEDIKVTDSSYYLLLNGNYSTHTLNIDFQGGVKSFSDIPLVAVKGLKGEYGFSGNLRYGRKKKEIDVTLVGVNPSIYSAHAKNIKAVFRGWSSGSLTLSLDSSEVYGIAIKKIKLNSQWGKFKDLPFEIDINGWDQSTANIIGNWRIADNFSITLKRIKFIDSNDTLLMESPIKVTKSKKWLSLAWEDARIFGGKLNYLVGAIENKKNTIDLHLSVDKVKLDKIAKLARLENSLSGLLDLNLEVTGKLTNPNASLQLSIKRPKFEKLVGDSLLLRLNYTGNLLSLDTVLFEGTGTSVNGRISIPLVLSLSPFKLTGMDKPIKGNLKTPGIDVSVINNLIGGQFAMEAGTLKANLEFGGTSQKPVFRGEFSLRSKTALMEPLSLELRDLVTLGRFKEDTLYIDFLKASSGRGKLNGSGVLILERVKPKWIDFRLSMKRLTLEPDPNTEVTVSGDLIIKGDTKAPVIEGNTHIDEAFIYLPFGSKGGGTTQRPTPIRYFIRVTGEKGIFVMNELMNIELGGDLEIKKEDEIHTSLTGKLDVLSGTFLYADRVFRITEGHLQFLGGSKINPTLDIVGQTTINDTILVTLRLSGTSEKPEIILSSDPPLPTEDIIAYLTFGRPLSEIPISLSDVNMLRERALNLAEGLLSAQLRKKLRVSELELGTGLLGGDPHFTVGFYLSRHFYLKYSFDPQSLEKNVFLTRYFLTRRTAVYVQRDREGEFAAGFELFFRF